jgi:hypothetical protein
MYQTNPTEMFRERELLLMRRKVQERRRPRSHRGGRRPSAAFGRMIASSGRRRETGETVLGLRSHSANISLLPTGAWFPPHGLPDAAVRRHR